MRLVATFLAGALGVGVVPWASAPARATGFSDVGFDLEAHQDEAWSVELGGYLRVRGGLFGNLDLDRGPLASGELLFPVPIDDPSCADAHGRGSAAPERPGDLRPRWRGRGQDAHRRARRDLRR